MYVPDVNGFVNQHILKVTHVVNLIKRATKYFSHWNMTFISLIQGDQYGSDVVKKLPTLYVYRYLKKISNCFFEMV